MAYFTFCAEGNPDFVGVIRLNAGLTTSVPCTTGNLIDGICGEDTCLRSSSTFSQSILPGGTISILS